MYVKSFPFPLPPPPPRKINKWKLNMYGTYGIKSGIYWSTFSRGQDLELFPIKGASLNSFWEIEVNTSSETQRCLNPHSCTNCLGLEIKYMVANWLFVSQFLESSLWLNYMTLWKLSCLDIYNQLCLSQIRILSNDRLSQRSIQVLFSLFSTVFTPHKSHFL